MKREHTLEALCVDGTVISFDQIQAMRGRIVQAGSWHYLQVDGEPERAVVLRPTLREALRVMGDYAREKRRKAKPDYRLRVTPSPALPMQTRGRGLRIVRQLHPDLYELPQLDNMRRSDGEPESYVMV